MSRSLKFTAAALAFGITRGIKEGMVMSWASDKLHSGILTGIRGHDWFQYYHLITIFVFVFFAIMILVYLWDRPRILFAIGALLLAWEATELGYSIARYGTIFVSHEHYNFADIISINLEGYQVMIVHIGRIVSGLSFMWLGEDN